MKNIITLLSFALLTILASSCGDGKEWPQPSIQLVPVYEITGISGAGAPSEVDLYRTVNLVIVFKNANTPLAYYTTDFQDTSDETNYHVTATVENQVTLEDGTTAKEVVLYSLEADKTTGAGTLTVTTTDAAGNTSEKSYTVSSVQETEKYN